MNVTTALILDSLKQTELLEMDEELWAEELTEVLADANHDHHDLPYVDTGHVVPKRVWAVVAKMRPAPTAENPKPRLQTWVRTYGSKADATSKAERLVKNKLVKLEDGDSVKTYESKLEWVEL